jgi:hypothetical protein
MGKTAARRLRAAPYKKHNHLQRRKKPFYDRESSRDADDDSLNIYEYKRSVAQALRRVHSARATHLC